MTPRPVRVVVVAYNAADSLDHCLAALAQEAPTIVVDNSRSAEVRAVAERHGVDYLVAQRNLGFGAGVNLALREFGDRTPVDVLLLNPDTTFSPESLRTLAGFLHRPRNERVGAVAPRLVDVDGSEQRVAWPFPTPARAWVEAIGLGGRGARDFVIGAVLLLRYEAIREVGLFDERFFLYAEETDWQRRAAAMGWGSAVCDEVVATHQGAGTSTDARRREALFHAGQETYIRKWHGQRGWLLYRVAVCCGSAARALVLSGERRSEAARRAMLYLRGPRRSARLVQE